MHIGHSWPRDTFLNAMATLEEVDSNIKEIAAKIKTLKASETAEPATISALVVSERKGHHPQARHFAHFLCTGGHHVCQAVWQC